MRELLKGFGEAGLMIQVKFVVIGLIFPGNFSKIAAFIEAPARERDRKSLQFIGRVLGGVMNNGRRIQPSAGPNAYRDICNELLSDCVAEQKIEFLFSCGQRETC